MIRAATVLLCLGLPGLAAAQSVLPAEEVVADTYIQAFPETGARIAVFEAGQGFREELFERDVAGVFDTLMPGQPPITQADIIIARVDDWAEAAAVFADTPLHLLSETARNLPADQTVYLQETQMFGQIDVLTFTVLNESDGQVVHARCMARLVIDTLYTGADADFDLIACSREME
ncbi:hypothetical protein [Gymnodinialimonas hymeniacidonis]|uniref:hypothetical protein n=1 Tax=Gymnodinialimonas hymeniacidonis TaxID=3126508 RepID=UPI0034C68BDF